MKKFYFLIALCALLISCGQNQPTYNQNTISLVKRADASISSGDSTLVVAGAPRRLTSTPGYDVPDENGNYKVYFFIRIDGNIPGEDEVNLPAKEYFPRTANNRSVLSVLNSGLVRSDVDWKTNFKFSKYIYATDGVAVQNIIVKEPTLQDLVNANGNAKDVFTGYLNNQDSLHFIWYVCKKQDADKCWHIDGILTSKDRTDISDTDFGESIINNYKKDSMISEVDGMVETNLSINDPHEVGDYISSKLSIHVRALTDVRVTLPIDKQFYCVADDMDISLSHKEPNVVYNVETEVVDVQIGTTTVTLTIEYNDESIVITTDGIDKEVLSYCSSTYGDGLTFEVWNYYKDIKRSELKSILDNSYIEFLDNEPIHYTNTQLVDNDCTVSKK